MWVFLAKKLDESKMPMELIHFAVQFYNNYKTM
jgi:hypothetical protein